MKKACLILLIFLTGIHLDAQPVQRAYPKGYFRNPLGIPFEIVANFGELRPNHWHMGLDIRTDQKENQHDVIEHFPVWCISEEQAKHIEIGGYESFGSFNQLCILGEVRFSSTGKQDEI